MKLLWNLTERQVYSFILYTKNKTFEILKEVLSHFEWHACFEFPHQRSMTCPPKLYCNISDKNTNIWSDIVLLLCYESIYILPLNSVYSSTKTLSMIISNLVYDYIKLWKIFQAFPYMIFHSYLLTFPANIFTLSPLACHTFHKCEYRYWSTLSLYGAWKNLAMFWFSCNKYCLSVALNIFLLPPVFCLGQCYQNGQWLLDCYIWVT